VRFGQGFLFSPPRPLRTDAPQPPAGVSAPQPPPTPAVAAAQPQRAGLGALARRSVGSP
jgi:cyclic-di-GMP phosphodiesterase TipF (flagellum assembly factor)